MAHAFDNRREIDERLGTKFDRVENCSFKPNSYPTMSNHQQISVSSNDSSLHQRQQAIISDYLSFTRQNSPIENKPPPPARMPRMTSIINDNYFRRSNLLSSQDNTNRIGTSTKYLSAAELYINQPTYDQPPPPPPPRCPIKSTQTNSVTIPDFNSSNSPRTIYRSTSSTAIERQFQSLSFDETPAAATESIVGESFGNCLKCGEIITSSDDPCDLLGKTYHGFCAICCICKQSVKNKHFYIHDQLYCEDDFQKLNCNQSNDYCVVCHRLINDTIIQALGESYHVGCFQCSRCSMDLDGQKFLRDKSRNLLCLQDYYTIYGLKCDKCKKTIYPEDDSNETVRIVSMGKNFHIKCYQCEDCLKQLGEEQDRLCYPMDGALLCQDCSHRRLIYTNKF